MTLHQLSIYESLSPEHANYELRLFRSTFIKRLAGTVGRPVLLQDSSDVAKGLLRQEWDSFSGVLMTNNKKRTTDSYSLILAGRLVGCIYMLGNDQLEESNQICAKAIERDLGHEMTSVRLYSVAAELIRASSALFLGSRSVAQRGICLKDEIEKVVSCNSKIGLIIAGSNSVNYYVFISPTQLEGVMAAIHTPKTVKLGFSKDASLLSFESTQDQYSYLELLEISDNTLGSCPELAFPRSDP